MKILLLGGSGLVGHHILKKTSGVFDFTSTYKNNEINLPGTNSICLSLPNQFNNLKDLILDKKPDVVINAVAHSGIEFCESHKKEAYALHVELTEKLSYLCLKANFRLIFISTDNVFDGTKGSYSEHDKTDPVNYYGYTKRLAEIHTLDNSKNAVVRTSLIYGWDTRVRFFNDVIKDLRNGKEILAYEDIFNCPTLIDELVDAISKIIISGSSGIFHAVGSSCINRFEFAKSIARKFGYDENLVKSVTSEDLQLTKRPKKCCLNNERTQKVLDMKFSTVEQGINKVLENKYRNNLS